MKGSYIEDLANHGGPELCVGVPRGRSEALGRGARRPAIEPRNEICLGCRRGPHRRKATLLAAFSRAVGGPRGVREPGHACDLSMFENREIPWSPACGDGWAGRAGNTEVVIL